MQMAGVKGLATVELSGNIRHKTITHNDKEFPGMLSSKVISNSVAAEGAAN